MAEENYKYRRMTSIRRRSCKNTQLTVLQLLRTSFFLRKNWITHLWTETFPLQPALCSFAWLQLNLVLCKA
ncbi:hypothetical protein PHYPO_G00044770 [Pangasianodon hypophthalmus]|uniref:Uncharacterized protein n=1 Tax=Pangasianodon hypophthalmus TaxID=310915 RepID=A0A5N5MHP4_PANHP|nr:hypothetical protein PHYPO_G00044770 [Pangasianodon hypophthalmus]